MYCLTTMAAIAIGYGFILLMKAGDASLLPAVEKVISSGASISAPEVAISLKDTLLNMIPSNSLDPFVQSNMIQIIVLTILPGIASKVVGEYSEPVQNFVKAGNAVFTRITSYISLILPVVIFCMMADMTMTLYYAIFGQVMRVILTGLASYLFMIVFYSFLLVVLAGW